MRTDKQLQQTILEELEFEPVLEPAEIGVSVKHGIVTLSGVVDASAKKIAAEEAIKRVRDVKGLAEEITVVHPHYGHRTDEDIVEAVIDALEMNNLLPGNKIKVKAENGWLTLSGRLPWQFQKESATRVVEDMIGVKGVHNLVEVQNRTNIQVFTDAAPHVDPKRDKVYRSAAAKEYSVVSIALFVIVVAIGLFFSIELFHRLFKLYYSSAGVIY